METYRKEIEERPQRVLLVENSDVDRKRMQRLIAALGYDLTVVKDASQALDALGADDFDIVLSGLESPARSGIQIGEQVNRRALFERPYFIVVSSCAEEAAQSRAADEHLAKPVRKEPLEESLQRGELSVARRRESHGMSS